jgi:hypothetical protein
LISFISEARVVDFPDQTHHVISTKPAFLLEKFLIISGILSSSNSGILFAIILKTRPYPHLCLNQFTLNLPSHSAWTEKSNSISLINSSFSFSGIIVKISCLSSSQLIFQKSSRYTISPLFFTAGKFPGDIMISEAQSSIAFCNT